MQAKSIEQVPVTTAHISPPPRLSMAQKRIAKLEERQKKLDTARAKAVKELEDEEKNNTIASGQEEFLAALAALDPTTREMVVSNVLQATESPLRRSKIQAWIAILQKPESCKDGMKAEGKIEGNDRNGADVEGGTDGDESTDPAPNADSKPIT